MSATKISTSCVPKVLPSILPKHLGHATIVWSARACTFFGLGAHGKHVSVAHTRELGQ